MPPTAHRRSVAPRIARRPRPARPIDSWIDLLFLAALLIAAALFSTELLVMMQNTDTTITSSTYTR